MFKVLKNECYLKGINTIQSGSFTNDQGQEIPFEGYTQVILTVQKDIDKMQDIKVRIPNNSQGKELTSKITKEELMTKLYVDLDVEVSTNNQCKIYLLDFTKNLNTTK